MPYTLRGRIVLVFGGSLLLLVTGAVLLAGRGAGQAPSTSSATTSRATAPVSVTSTLPTLKKSTGEPQRYHQVLSRDNGRDAVGVWEKGPSPTAQFAKRALVPLTPEEEDVLRHHPPEDLSQLIAGAMQAYVHADDAHRAEADRRYLMLLNLAAKLESDRVSATPAEIHTQHDYLNAVAAKQAAWQQLSPPQRAERESEFKYQFFQTRLGPHKEIP